MSIKAPLAYMLCYIEEFIKIKHALIIKYQASFHNFAIIWVVFHSDLKRIMEEYDPL